MKRIEALLKDVEYQEHITRNMNAEREHPFCKHDLQHMLDVARIAYIIVLEHNDLEFFVRESGLAGKLAAKEVIYAAGMMHDIAKWKEYETGVDHAAEGSHLARELLSRAQFSEKEINVITTAIYEHRNVSRDMSFLGEKLHRADNLSRVCMECPEKQGCVKYKKRETGSDYLVY